LKCFVCSGVILWGSEFRSRGLLSAKDCDPRFQLKSIFSRSEWAKTLYLQGNATVVSCHIFKSHWRWSDCLRWGLGSQAKWPETHWRAREYARKNIA
jgi:hypothetical protein